jgi:hypothetical protein
MIDDERIVEVPKPQIRNDKSLRYAVEGKVTGAGDQPVRGQK